MTSSKRFLYRKLHLKGKDKTQIQKDEELLKNSLNRMYRSSTVKNFLDLIKRSKRFKELYPDHHTILSSSLVQLEHLYLMWCQIPGNDYSIYETWIDSFQTLNCSSCGGQQEEIQKTGTNSGFTMRDLQRLDKLIMYINNKIHYNSNIKQFENNMAQSKHNSKLQQENEVQSVNNEAQMKHNEEQKIANINQGKDLERKLQAHLAAMRESLNIVCDTLEVLFEEYVMLYTTFQYPTGTPPPYT
ncbi:hypothetical protein CAAN3_19S01640 [[Candida] anglica]